MKRIIRFIKKIYYKIKIKIAISFLKDVDETMKRAYWTRIQRRAFWQNFAKRNKEILNEFLDIK